MEDVVLLALIELAAVVVGTWYVSRDEDREARAFAKSEPKHEVTRRTKGLW